MEVMSLMIPLKRRQKLSQEHTALIVLNMRIRYGAVQRIGNPIRIMMLDTCIDCGWPLNIGDCAQSAWWDARRINGFYAHYKCAPVHTTWIMDDRYVDIFSTGDYNHQSCKWHPHNQVAHRIIVNDLLQYVCEECIGG